MNADWDLSIVEVILNYERNGMETIPLKPERKDPAVCNWQSYLATPTSIHFWHKIRKCNVGGRTGKYIVLDMDNQKAKNHVQGLGIDSSMKSLTGSGAGEHWFFLCPEGIEVRNRQGLFGVQGLDVRGKGGLVVLPPSIHPETKKPYLWLTEFQPAKNLPPFPLGSLTEPKREVQRVIINGDADRMERRALAYLAKVPGAISGQRGHDRTMHAAGILIQKFGLGFDRALRVFKIWNETCLPPWDEKSLIHKLESALKNQRNS